MRIRLKLSPKPGEALLPSKYQHLVGSALYSLVDDRQQHDSKTTKLFCSSPLFWKERILEGDKIRFRGPGYLVFCSADLHQINKIFSKRAIEIGGNLFDLHQGFIIGMAYRGPKKIHQDESAEALTIPTET